MKFLAKAVWQFLRLIVPFRGIGVLPVKQESEEQLRATRKGRLASLEMEPDSFRDHYIAELRKIGIVARDPTYRVRERLDMGFTEFSLRFKVKLKGGRQITGSFAYVSPGNPYRATALSIDYWRKYVDLADND